ncbi:MAG: dihydrofolate reductase family protein [Bacteroidota bacterium]
MRKIVVGMHVSLDGFVGGPNGEMNWIKANDEVFTYSDAMTKAADTALYGRTTFGMMESYWPTAAEQPNATKHDIAHAAWYKKVDKIVLSKTMQDAALKNTTVIGENVAEKISALKQQAGKNIQIFGSPRAVHSLMQANLIDDFWLFVNPVILGEGIPFFKVITERIQLKLVSNEALKCGVLVVHYERVLD